MANRSKTRFGKATTRIRNMRIAFGLTQKQLADKLGKGESTVRSWEIGKSEPDLETVSKIAKIFSVSTDYFLREGDIIWGEETTKWLFQISLELNKPYEEIVDAFTNNPYGIKADGVMTYETVRSFILAHYSEKKIRGEIKLPEQILSPDSFERLSRIAASRNVTVSELITDAVTMYLDRYS